VHLVVTRPEEDARPLAERLRALGHEVVVEPMLAIVIDRDAVLDPGPWRAILVTSANGIRALAGRLETTGLLEIPVLTVGTASAEAAREAGFASVTSADGDLDALASLVRATIAPGDGRLLYVTGRTVSGDLAGMLGREGYDVVRQVLYDAVAVDRLSRPLADAIRAGSVDGVLLFSRRSARIWADATLRHGLGAASGAIGHFCLSPAIAAVIAEAISPPPPVMVAERPDIDALLRLLDRWRHAATRSID
jgi:uroporphyrinogen-III synthase